MIGNKIININDVDSTNSYLSKILDDKEVEEGLAVIANNQTEGRGQFKNRWESTKGLNILISFVIYPQFLNAERQFMLSKFTSLGIKYFLNDYLDDVKIKWPNDIYVKDKKIAGVLIENTLRSTVISSSVIGIGVNVNQTLFSSTIPNPGSLMLETAKSFDIDKLIVKLFVQLNFWYNRLINMEFDAINNEYLASLYQYNQQSDYHDNTGDFKATIVDIDLNGRLCLLDSDNQLRTYAFKEVVFGKTIQLK